MPPSRNSRRDTPLEVASGVDQLIARLRDEGVKQGRADADQLVADAQKKADATLQQAEEQAARIIGDARHQADTLATSSRQALDLAFRDTVLALKSQLSEGFAGEVRRLVGEQQEKQDLLEKMILEVAGRVRKEVDEAQQVEVLLPHRIQGLAELSQNPEELENGILTTFVRLVSQDMLRQGVSFGFFKENQTGLKLRLVDRDIVLDITDEAVANALLQHLQPRFRSLLEGVVK